MKYFLLTGCAVYSIDKRVQKDFNIKKVSIMDFFSHIMTVYCNTITLFLGMQTALKHFTGTSKMSLQYTGIKRVDENVVARVFKYVCEIRIFHLLPDKMVNIVKLYA